MKRSKLSVFPLLPHFFCSGKELLTAGSAAKAVQSTWLTITYERK